jgi:Mor family transcriptional regulator
MWVDFKIMGESMLTEENKQEIADLYVSGLGSDTISKKYNIHPNTVLKILKNKGIKRRQLGTIFTDQDKNNIINLYTNGSPVNELAKKFKFRPQKIKKIVKLNNIMLRTVEESHRKYAINENFFDVIDNEEKAYFLGFLYADGCNHKKSNYVSLSLKSDDKEILIKLAKLIFKDDYENRIVDRDRSAEDKGIESIININSKHICKKLEELGCAQTKTFKITYPEWMPDNLHKHFIRGYFDGDGSIYVNEIKERGSKFKITSTLDFVTGIKNIINKEAKINSIIYKHSKSKVYDVNACGDRQVKKFLDWIYDDSHIFLKRKYEQYLKLLQLINKKDKLAAAGTRGYNKKYL